MPVNARTQPSALENTSQHSSTTQVRLWHILDRIEAVQVPHRWFFHFYAVSITLSLFWSVQFLIQGKLMTSLCSSVTSGKSMSKEQVILTWVLMTVQGGRRLSESIYLGKPSSSKMLFVHWVLGILFYCAMSVAVWIEGAGIFPRAISVLQPGADANIDYRGPSLVPANVARPYTFRTFLSDVHLLPPLHFCFWRSA